MRKNTSAVFSAWLAGRRAPGASISTDGERILSYTTPLVIREAGAVRFNATRYSVTTSRQQNELRQLLGANRIAFSEIES